jgi:hypothetical protein
LNLHKIKGALYVETIKNHLGVFLSSIPDQPTLIGLGKIKEFPELPHKKGGGKPTPKGGGVEDTCGGKCGDE